jgi:hypothetical protein
MRLLLGLWRYWWRLCPACNSDAPELDDCPICEGFHGCADRKIADEWLDKWLGTFK